MKLPKPHIYDAIEDVSGYTADQMREYAIAMDTEHAASQRHLFGVIKQQAQEIGRLRTALEMAIRQNEHDMIMTGENLRKARTALEKQV